MALDPVKVERLARETRLMATVAAAICNCDLPEHDARAIDLLHTLDDALENTHELLREIVDGA